MHHPGHAARTFASCIAQPLAAAHLTFNMFGHTCLHHSESEELPLPGPVTCREGAGRMPAQVSEGTRGTRMLLARSAVAWAPLPGRVAGHRLRCSGAPPVLCERTLGVDLASPRRPGCGPPPCRPGRSDRARCHSRWHSCKSKRPCWRRCRRGSPSPALQGRRKGRGPGGGGGPGGGWDRVGLRRGTEGVEAGARAGAEAGWWSAPANAGMPPFTGRRGRAAERRCAGVAKPLGLGTRPGGASN